MRIENVNPDENLDEDEFYFKHASGHQTMEEFRAAQNPPLRLLIGLKKLKNYHDPKLIKSFTTILGSLMQGTDGQVVDYLKRKDYPSSISLNILTVNHANLTRSPKLDSRELKSWPIKHQTAHHADDVVIQVHRMLCPRWETRQSRTVGTLHFNEEPILEYNIRNVQMLLRARRRLQSGL